MSLSPIVAEFNAYRARMNERILASDSRVLKRIYSVDAQAYEPGALDAKTKELLGLATSLVLRCDDCVRYHIGEALRAGATEHEIVETFEVCTVVGGTIVIPHLRRAFEFLDASITTELKA
jgi:AhpD family alkylhydroperoxidase